MRRFRFGMALPVACAALLLAGCGGGASTPQTLSAPVTDEVRGEADGAPEEAAAAPRESTRQGRSVTSGVEVARQERQVIYVARLSVRVKEVAAAAQRAKQFVASTGGHLAKEESRSGDRGGGSATLEFKVPPARYSEVLTALGRDLGEQISLTQGTEDVTLRVADVESRLASARQSLDSLRALLKKAGTIGEVLQVEREISAREADLESLQAQQKELAGQVGMATLTLRLVGPRAVVADPSAQPPGFLGGLAAGWAALVMFGKVALTVLGAVLPWLAVVVPLVAFPVVAVRRRRRRRTPSAPPSAPEPPSTPEPPSAPAPQAP
ncbi:DUF4349 domain-containing protein [Nonomuraea sp. NPDC047897]|uniref:DUF4349 domain-containing protein n=1 Tax=Nonomuraea sp. NPDC047897 TaxID=3364346 RepID=UPI00371BA194